MHRVRYLFYNAHMAAGMESINAYFEIGKEKTYEGVVRLYGFEIAYYLEPVFDNRSRSIRLIANFAQSRLFGKLGRKLEKELKLSLTAGVFHCYQKFNHEKTTEEGLEKAVAEELNSVSAKNEEIWDCITSEMILQVPKSVKQAIERISSEGPGSL